MPSIDIQFSPAQIKAAEDRLNGVKVGLPVAMAGAINDTAKQGKTKISSKIRAKVLIPKNKLDPEIKVYPRATPSSLQSGIHLSKKERLELKWFGARQTQAGVTYKISATGGRTLVPGAFIGPGGHVFVRKFGANKGLRKNTNPATAGLPSRVGRKPIDKVKGVSAWGVVVKNNMLPDLKMDIGKDLSKNLERRVNFLVLKRSGAI